MRSRTPEAVPTLSFADVFELADTGPCMTLDFLSHCSFSGSTWPYIETLITCFLRLGGVMVYMSTFWAGEDFHI